MSENKKNSEKDKKRADRKRNGKLGGHLAAPGQMFRMVLYTSVIWYRIIYRICQVSESENILRYLAISALFALYIIGVGILYEKFGAGKEILLRFFVPLCFLAISNGLCLGLIWRINGRNSYLFRNSAILAALSALFFLADFIYFLLSVLEWKRSRKVKKSQVRQNLDTEAEADNAGTDCRDIILLPKEALRKIPDSVLLVGMILLFYLVIRQLVPSGPADAPLFQLVLLMIFLAFAAVVFVYRFYAWILSTGKYKLHRLDGKEETDE